MVVCVWSVCAVDTNECLQDDVCGQVCVSVVCVWSVCAVDTNECLQDNVCGQVCVSVVRVWSVCAVDTNECLQDDVCGQGQCVNVDGGFECQCADGYAAGVDGTCEGKVQATIYSSRCAEPEVTLEDIASPPPADYSTWSDRVRSTV